MHNIGFFSLYHWSPALGCGVSKQTSSRVYCALNPKETSLMSCLDTTVGDGVTETSLVADASGENERGGYCFKSPRRPVTLLGWYPSEYFFITLLLYY